MGRVVGDVLIHYLNVVGAYIVCATILAVALYLTTAFSFSAIQLWAPTRFAFVHGPVESLRGLAAANAPRNGNRKNWNNGESRNRSSRRS